MTRADGEREEHGGFGADNDRADDPVRQEPVELTEEVGRLDLDDDEPPLPWLQGDDDDEEFDGSSTGQLVGLVLLGLLAIGVIVGGIWWVKHKSAEEVLVADGSVVAPPAQPYKERPANPGGKVFEGTGDTSFGISEGQKHPARLGEQTPVAAPSPGFGSMDKAGDKGAKPGDKPADKPAAADNVPGIGVQVAAYSNREQAEAGWARLSQQYQALSGVKHRVVEGQADIGTVYRLQAVAPDGTGARTLCQKLKSAGLNCQVKN